MRADEPAAHATDTVVAVQWVARAKSPVSNDALVMDGIHIVRFRWASAPPWCRFRAKAVRPLRSRRGRGGLCLPAWRKCLFLYFYFLEELLGESPWETVSRR
jgi:hypothetical protein